jgi:superfamily II DNA/RNA helicase
MAVPCARQYIHLFTLLINLESQVLITTNVVARGLDVMQVNMVVNYDIPLMGERRAGDPQSKKYFKEDNAPDVETYIHRIGMLCLPISFISY